MTFGTYRTGIGYRYSPNTPVPNVGETFFWIENDGTPHQLSGMPNSEVERGDEGLWMPPVQVIADELPLQAGSLLRRVKVQQREIALPLTIFEQSRQQVWLTQRTILSWFAPERGPGQLQVLAPDGSIRQITATYSGGLQGRTGESSGVSWSRYIITLVAPDPYFYDATTQVVTWNYTAGISPATFFPFFPLRLTNAAVLAQPTITNPGDVVAWPVWTITGPGANPALRNLTTGESIILTGTLAAGETITVDTRPGKKTVLKNDGTSWYPQNDSSLWALQTGSNSLQLELDTATNGSQMQMTYNAAYRSV